MVKVSITKNSEKHTSAVKSMKGRVLPLLKLKDVG
jgi:hypothetical protein